MQPLPREFLKAVARKYGLSRDQTDAFVIRFGSGATEFDDAAELNISVSALRSRMTEVYKKFSIKTIGPGKLYKLHDFLMQRYQRLQTPQSQALGNTNDLQDYLKSLVQDIRDKVKDDIQNRCGAMRVLDMEQKIGLDDIYISVNILEKLSGRQRLSKDELLEDYDPKNFSRFLLGQINQKRMLGLTAVEEHNKLMVLGKPGAGKTTFMKYVAMLCSQEDEFQSQRVPVFVTLKEFAEAEEEPSLQDYILDQWTRCGVSKIHSSDAVLTQGAALILLDGLDEVQEADQNRVLREVEIFTRQYHNCQFVITCRIAAQEYTFEQFSEVEVADFNDEQIAEFSNKWFTVKNDPKKGQAFIQKLDSNKPIKELATNPLLLTLLCLVFGEAADFPANRSELYKEGLDVLLKKWDAKRNIARHQIYKKLSLQRKEDLLSQLAFYTFEHGDYFFKQNVVEQQIASYIRNLSGVKDDADALQVDSEDVLKSIEAQHGLLVERAKGIYSFSHLTFQEYFSARQITRPTGQLYVELKKLSIHITEKRYREVFLLAVEMLPEADDLLRLMKQQIDRLLAGDPSFQKLLHWLYQKVDSIDVSYKDAARRAFYIYRDLYRDLDHDRDRYLYHDIHSDRYRDLYRDLYRDRDHGLYIHRDRDLYRDHDLDLDRDLYDDLDLFIYRNLDHVQSCDLDRINDPELKLKLQELREQLPRSKRKKILAQWWENHAENWAKQLRSAIIEHRNIGHKWQFTKEQKEKLQQYYDANKLLVECLNSDCYVTKATRQEIEDTLLLPISEIEKRQGNNLTP